VSEPGHPHDRDRSVDDLIAESKALQAQTEELVSRMRTIVDELERRQREQRDQTSQ
jgi:prefoldin subunit 5